MLKFPLEQINSQHSHSVRQLSFLASAHVLDLLCDVLDINSRQLARTQQRGLLAGPCHHVFLVTCVHYVLLWGHHRKRKKSYAKRALRLASSGTAKKSRASVILLQVGVVTTHERSKTPIEAAQMKTRISPLVIPQQRLYGP